MYKLELSNFNKKIYLLNSMSADQEADNNRYVHQDLIVKTFARTRISICH